MSDANLRELERRWRVTGSVEDEAAWLWARLQAGDLSEERLELSAYCGSKAACSQVESAGPESIEEWSAGLLRWGRPVVLRALVSALRHAFANLPGPQESAGASMAVVESAILPRSLRTLGTMDDWILSPNEKARKKVSKSASGLGRALDRLSEEQRERRRPVLYQRDRLGARLTPRDRAVVIGARGAHQGIQIVTSNAPDQLEAVAATAVRQAALAVETVAPNQGRRIACSGVISWALGYSDPVRERVEARQREAVDHD